MNIYPKEYLRKIIIHFFITLFSLTFPISLVVKQADCQQIEFKEKHVLKLAKGGSKLFEKKKYAEALEKLIQTEKEATIAQDKVAISNMISGGGYLLYQERELENSLSYFKSALEINERLDFKPGLINNYSFIAIINTDQGYFMEGIGLFQKALSIQKDLGEKAGIAQNLNNVATFTSYLGDYDRAIQLLNQALSISDEIKDPLQRARTLLNLGTINLRLRNYQEAIAYLNASYSIADAAEKQDTNTQTYIEPGVLPGEQEKYKIDTDDDNLAKEIRKQLMTIKAQALTAEGVVYRFQGNYAKAIDDYMRALKINEDLELKTQTAINISIIGELYKEIGRYGEATKFIKKSLKMSEENKDQIMIGVNLNYLGEIKYKQKDYKEALNLYYSSLEIFEELGFKDRIARILVNIGYLKLEMHDYESAIENFNKAIAMYRSLGDREWTRVALFGKAVALEEMGNLAQAEATYREAVEIFESIRQDVVGGEEGQRIFSEVNEELYEKLISLLLRMGKKEEASKYIERSKSKKLRDTLLDTGITSFDENVRALLDQYDQLSRQESSLSYELAQERSKPNPNRSKIKNLEKTIANTKNRFNDLNSSIVTQYPQINYLLGISPQGLSELRQEAKIPENVAILQYFITKNEAFLFIATKDKLVVETIPISKKELNTLVSQYRDVILRNNDIPANNWLNGNKSILDFKNLSARLYDLLIKPAESHITDVDTLAIVPFGSLNLLPFHSLAKKRSGDGGLEFFIEQKNIIYLTSTNYLNMILRLSKDKRIETVAAFGNPELGHPRWDLPFASEEVLTIKSIYPNTAVFLGKDATKANFKKTWGQNSIMHLAAHGIAKEREPLNENQAKSRALCKARGVCTAEDEGPLLEEERPVILLAPYETGYITNQVITGLPPATVTRLIVLSGCETAVFYEEEDPDVNQLPSLALAFTWVGIPSILATLWSINDEGTSILMKDFYTNLRSGKGLYQSLKEAQLKMLKRGDKYGQPYYWVPFILFGAWD